MTAYWLIKSEPDEYSVEDFQRERRTLWDRVRNYEARNNLCRMKPGDLCLFYHSNAEPSGIAGIAKVAKQAVPDPEQFNRKSEYFDEKATKENPRWFAPELEFVERFSSLLPLARLKQERRLAGMVLLRRGSRLSVQPVTTEEFSIVRTLGKNPDGNNR